MISRWKYLNVVFDEMRDRYALIQIGYDQGQLSQRQIKVKKQ